MSTDFPGAFIGIPVSHCWDADPFETQSWINTVATKEEAKKFALFSTVAVYLAGGI